MEKNVGKVVIDQATDEDHFGGQGHLRTSRQICSAIQEFAEQSEDRSIGLYGDWGSGKSSVIVMAKKHLTDSGQNFRFFTFDLWSANATNFKRSLLEEFIDWAIIERSEKEEELEEQRDKVRDREVTTTSDLKLLLSPFGLFFLCLVPFIPLAYAWLGPESFNEKNRTLQMPYFEYEITGWALAVFLFLSIFIVAACSTVRLWRKKGTLREAASQVISMASHKEKKNTVTQNVREKDPNEHEFDALFRELLALVQDDGSRVVMVFDNIDRLPHEEIAAYWALVRSVFSVPSHKQNESKKCCLVIVPYAKEAIERVFEIEEHDHDFFSKTFDVNLRVAPPVLSNVSEFLDANLSKRFETDLDAPVLSAIRKIFEQYMRSSSRGVATPRRVISFVNEIADLASVWGKDIGLGTIATYVANRQLIEKNPLVLQEQDSAITPYLRMDTSETPTKFLAALAYNVEPDLAYQTLLEPDIVQAIMAKDTDKLVTLEKTEGYTQVLQDVVEKRSSELASQGAQTLSLLAQSITRTFSDSYLNSQAATDILTALEQLPSEGAWLQENIDALEPTLRLLKGSPMRKVIEPLASWAGHPIGDDPDFDTGVGWATASGSIIQVMANSEIGDSKDMSAFFDTAQSPDFAIGVASVGSKTSLDLASLKRLFAARNLKEPVENVVRATPEKTSTIISGLKAAAKFNSTISNSILSTLQKELCDTRIEDVAIYETLTLAFADAYDSAEKSNLKGRESILEELFSNGGFVWHIHDFGKEELSNGPTALALELALKSFSVADYATRPNQNVGGVFSNFHPSSVWFKQLTESMDQLVNNGMPERIASRTTTKNLRQLIDLAQESRQISPLARLVVIAASDAGNKYLMMAHYLTENEDWLRENAPNTLASMLEDIKDNITQGELDKIDIYAISPEFLANALETKGTGWIAYDKAIAKRFGDLDTENWNLVLSKLTGGAKLLKAKIDGLGARISAKSSNFLGPFEDHYLGLLSGSSEVTTRMGDQLLGVVNQTTKQQIVRSIAQKFAATDYTPETFVKTAKEFPDLTKLVLESEDLESASTVVLTKLVSVSSNSELKTLIAFAPSFKKHLDSTDQNALGALEQVLTEQSVVEEKSESILTLAKHLKVNVNFPKPSKD